jgi:hypothetical protein
LTPRERARLEKEVKLLNNALSLDVQSLEG